MAKGHKEVIPQTHTSKSEAARDTVVMIIIGLVLCAVLGWLVGLIYLPFIALPYGTKVILKPWHKKFLDRRARYGIFSADFEDPMHLYQKDPENPKYRKFYMDWAAGKIMDTEMRWAPHVYKQLDGYETMLGAILNPSFVDYLAIQLFLHKGKPEMETFLQVIKLFYPEFTPDENLLLEDIVEARKETQKEKAMVPVVAKLQDFFQLNLNADSALRDFIESNPDWTKLDEYKERLMKTGHLLEVTEDAVS